MKTLHDKKKIGLNIEINEKDREIIKELRENYSINITQLIKNHLKNTLNTFKKNKE